LILGAAALVAPLWVPEELIRFDLPLLAGVSVAALLCAIDGNVGRLQGAILLFGLFAWGLFELIGAQAGRKIAQRKKHQPFIKLSARSLTIAIGATLLGLGGVLGGAPLVVSGATSIARSVGVGDQVIALTVISLGTALPELATSIAAAFRGQGELAVGNVIGSNLFNLLGVLGASALASPHGVPVTRNALLLDMPVMLFGTLICIPILRSERTVSRAEGGALLLGYFVYVALRFHAAG
jgi:cation:H+ antiporter